MENGTPKEKASELYYKILNTLLKENGNFVKDYVGLNLEAISKLSEITCLQTKQTAIICIDGRIDAIGVASVHTPSYIHANSIKYWQEVKEEVLKF